MFSPSLEKDILKVWFRICLLSVTLVALYGVLMRYKIAFDFPIFEQKNLLHAHSHFAFVGWVSQFLYVGLYYWLTKNGIVQNAKRYKALLWINFISAMGMLISFTLQGYKALSITFSTIGLIVALIYAILYTIDSRKLLGKHAFRRWAVGGLWLGVISSLGPLTLASMMMSKQMNQELYLAAVYFYLHFQYNGWFFFGAMAMFLARLPSNSSFNKTNFIILFSCAIPTFFLSVLWSKPPMPVYIIAVIATLIQAVAWFLMLKKLIKNRIEWNLVPIDLPKWLSMFYFGVVIAVSLKFILQCFSAIPWLSHEVFGLRPVVIAYLHLVLLGIYSLFILGYLFTHGWIKANKLAIVASSSFLLGVVLNELFLAIQGVAGFSFISVPYVNEMLLGAALLLFISAFSLFISQFGKSETTK